MRLVRSIITLGALVALQLPRLAASVPYFDEPPPFNAHMYGGFREDFLKFHIGGEQPNSKNFSKVEFNELKMAQIGGSVDYSTLHHYYMRARGDYGRIYEGTGIVRNKFLVHQLCCQDHTQDHLLDICPNAPKEFIDKIEEHKKHKDRVCCKGQKIRKKSHRHHRSHKPAHDHGTQNRLHFHKRFEESKQTGDIDTGHVGDLSGGLGWKVISNGGRGWIAGILGYSYETQCVELKHLKQKKDSLNVMGSCLEGLRGSYSTRWVGPWAGIDFSAMVECNVTVFGTAEWHILDYRGKGDWRLGNDYSARFKHHSRGWGAVGSLGFDWAPCDLWGFGLLFNYEQWSTRKGQNRAHIKNQLPGQSFLPFSFPVAQKSHLQRVKWVTYSVSAQASYRF